MAHIIQAILSVFGTFAAMFVAPDAVTFPICEFVGTLLFMAAACALALYWQKILRK